jgi:putative spermidine/putrescine transport system permease protein
VTAPTVPWNTSLQARSGLKAELRRTQRRRKLEAVALVAPLFLFLAVFFPDLHPV